jgi:O-6-methylguanine DNA methyltransferase
MTMSEVAHCMFDTPLGWCGIAWSEGGKRPAVRLLQLPEITPAMTKSRTAASSGVPEASAPPTEIAEVVQRVCQHLRGEVQDFRDVTVELDGAGLFARRVYAAVREIPAGETRTYGEIAAALCRPSAARAVGQVLGRNPIPLIIPCHRVLAAGGRPGGFSAPGGRATKLRLLAFERAPFGVRSGQLFLL